MFFSGVYNGSLGQTGECIYIVSNRGGISSTIYENWHVLKTIDVGITLSGSSRILRLRFRHQG